MCDLGGDAVHILIPDIPDKKKQNLFITMDEPLIVKLLGTPKGVRQNFAIFTEGEGVLRMSHDYENLCHITSWTPSINCARLETNPLSQLDVRAVLRLLFSLN